MLCYLLVVCLFIMGGEAFRLQRSMNAPMSLNVFKEHGGKPVIPSENDLPGAPLTDAEKKQKLDNLIDEYKDKKGQVFEDKLTFPCSFMIKIIGENEPSFVADTMGTVAEVLATQPAKVPMKLKETSGGKYVSVSITPKFETSAQIYSIYENLRKDPRVKFVV